MTDPRPVQQAADAWQTHRPALEALSARLARRDPILARSLEGAMQVRDAILVELVGERVARMAGDDADARAVGDEIAAQARAIAGRGEHAAQGGGR
ncbi:MAG: hypothetical protein H0U85_01220 [Gemmatimonadales bacterium]|nr:hypothetical protein [Gemmatimonadales bacterium]